MKKNRTLKRTITVLAIVSSVAMLLSCTKKSTEDTSMSTKTQKPLNVAMELAYPPFETKDSAGNPSGISVDFAKAFGESIGREVNIINTQWDGLIPSLQTGKVDMIVSSMTITEDRSKVVDFSVPYANSLLGILVNKDSGITKAEDLNQKGKKIAVKTGSTGFIYAKREMTNATIIALADESACVTEVSQGKADAFFYDQLTIYRNWQANKDTTEAIFVPFQDKEMWGVAVKKGNTELLNQLNAFIPQFTKDGGFDTLSQKYLAKEKKAFDDLGFKWFFDLN
jgi:polar amino acid transport system substrate-binding protein